MKQIFNKSNILLFGIILLSIILRFLHLDKTGGLWYDELVSYKEASLPNLITIIFYTLKTDVHMPLYPVFLHYWAKIFYFSDYALRAFSAVCGVLSVVAAYFVGKELKSKTAGLFCSSIFALNSFLIFYSQEVRLYSFLMLISTLFLLFLVKIKNDYKTKSNYIGLIISSLGLIYTHTIGFIFVFAEFFIFITYLFIENSAEKIQKLKNIFAALSSMIVIVTPFIIYMGFNYSHYTTQINGFYCDWSSLFVIIQAWFAPVLEGLYNNPVHYMNTLMHNINVATVIFILFPIFISIFAISKAIKKDKFSIVILGGALFFIACQIIAFKYTNFKILARYTSIVLPSILILVGYGISLLDFKTKKNKILIWIFFIINIFYLLLMPNSAFRLPRNGFRPLSEAIHSAQIQENDYIVVWNRTEVLDKYINKKLNVLSLLKNFAYSSEMILTNEKTLEKMSLEERKSALREYFADSSIPVNTKYLMDIIYKRSKPGQKFIITTTSNFDEITQEEFKNIIKDEQKYQNISYNDLLTIKSLLAVKKISEEKFRFVEKIKNDNFVVIVFQK